MPDLPGGSPPRITGPVQGVAPVSASGGGGRREPGADHRQRPSGDSVPSTPGATTGDAGPPAVLDPLVQALDRLRATSELRPVDAELLRLLRGLREYAGTTPPAGNPILDSADPQPPPA